MQWLVICDHCIWNWIEWFKILESAERVGIEEEYKVVNELKKSRQITNIFSDFPFSFRKRSDFTFKLYSPVNGQEDYIVDWMLHFRESIDSNIDCYFLLALRHIHKTIEVIVPYRISFALFVCSDSNANVWSMQWVAYWTGTWKEPWILPETINLSINVDVFGFRFKITFITSSRFTMGRIHL